MMRNFLCNDASPHLLSKQQQIFHLKTTEVRGKIPFVSYSFSLFYRNIVEFAFYPFMSLLAVVGGSR